MGQKTLFTKKSKRSYNDYVFMLKTSV